MSFMTVVRLWTRPAAPAGPLVAARPALGPGARGRRRARRCATGSPAPATCSRNERRAGARLLPRAHLARRAQRGPRAGARSWSLASLGRARPAVLHRPLGRRRSRSPSLNASPLQLLWQSRPGRDGAGAGVGRAATRTSRWSRAPPWSSPGRSSAGGSWSSACAQAGGGRRSRAAGRRRQAVRRRRAGGAAVRTVFELGDGLALAVAQQAGDGERPDPGAAGPYPTRRLQKGLLLLDGGQELTEEGVGFGVPVLKRGPQTVFPGSAELDVQPGGRPQRDQRCRLHAGPRRAARRARGSRRFLHRPLDEAPRTFAAPLPARPALRRPLTGRVQRDPLAAALSGPGTSRRRPARHRAGDLRRGRAAAATSLVTADLSRPAAARVTEVVLMNELGADDFDRYEDSDGADAARRRHRRLGRGPRRDGVASSLGRAASRSPSRATPTRTRPACACTAAARSPGPARLGRVRLLPAARPGRVHATRCASRAARSAVSSVLLIYPFFRRSLDRSRFRFPPLGPRLRGREPARGRPRRAPARLHVPEPRAGARGWRSRPGADVVGIYCMATMRDDALWFARRSCAAAASLLVAGGPLPTCDAGDVPRATSTWSCAARASRPWSTLLAAHAAGGDLGAVPGVVVAAADGGAAAAGPPRPFAADLDALPFPARDLLPNAAYISHGRRRYGYAVTTVMSTRGCPFACEFCSNVVFGSSYRERSPESVVDEVEQALALGYDRISFSDDVFTLRPERVVAVCDEIERRGLRFAWECLAPRGRHRPARPPRRMRRAGCRTVFFGIESGSDEVLRADAQGHHRGPGARRRLGRPRRRPRGRRLLHPVLPRRDRRHGARDAALRRRRCRSTTSGSRCRTRCRARACGSGWRAASRGESRPDGSLLMNQQLTYEGDFSAAKMRFAILTGKGQFELRRRLGRFGPAAVRLTQAPADALFRRLPLTAPSGGPRRRPARRRRRLRPRPAASPRTPSSSRRSRRRSQVSSMSELKTKVISFSCVQSRPVVAAAQPLPQPRARQRHRHVEGDLGQRQVERERERLLDVGRASRPGSRR